MEILSKRIALGNIVPEQFENKTEICGRVQSEGIAGDWDSAFTNLFEAREEN